MDPFTTPIESRGVERLVAGEPTSDGAGVRITRVFAHDLQRRLDPFLLLDHFASDDPSDYGAGFPDHPHRGFETVTYMIAGRMRHNDSAGHSGLLHDGGVQWMTAGRGLIHSEMPEQVAGRMEGFQLWLNLPAKDKMREPWYRDIHTEEIPEITTEAGVRVRIISGESQGLPGAMLRDANEFPTQPLYLDLALPPGARFTQPLPAAHNAFVYVFRESVRIAGTVVPTQQMAILSDAANNNAQGVTIEAPADHEEAARVLLIAGRPLAEPIAQYGPFVMNTREQVMEAVEDLRAGRFA